MPHDICHVEIRSVDPPRSREFLGKLFGWTFQPMDESYWFYSTPRGPGGGLEKVDGVPSEEGAFRIYVHVDSIRDTLARAEALGGEVRTPRTEIGGGHGFYAFLREPGGAVLGLWEAQGE